MSRELIFMKPDGIARKLVGRVISRFEDAGFSIARMQKGRISRQLSELLYQDSEAQLTGMGNKTIKAMTDKGNREGIMKLFETEAPFGIGKRLNEWNRIYATSSDVIAVIIEKDGDAVTEARAIVGKTDPEISPKGTIRGDFAADSIYKANLEKRACQNIVHASDVDTAEMDIKNFEKHFFR
ncbi:MAG: nucleoside-diphosphate kinase [Candidatus Marsarchaeota archaeon]|jgi:nucleoside-diphosphate kinase|nr:nucleoside-diphosphate kinase [Candidatus Marsarchaeota archaeon]